MRKKNAISPKIKALRKSLGLVQADFAKKIGIGTRTLASWESGEVEPPMGKVHFIFDVCIPICPDVVSLHFGGTKWWKGYDSSVGLDAPILVGDTRTFETLTIEVEQLNRIIEAKDDIIESLKSQLKDKQIIINMLEESIIKKAGSLKSKKVG